MSAFGKSQSLTRTEDLRLLTGAGRFIDDIAPEAALRGYFLRAAEAHARIRAIDIGAARSMPGVHLVITAADLESAGVRLDLPASLVTGSDGTSGSPTFRPILARDCIRFVGEPLALVVAETLDAARDAAEAIEVDTDPLPVHMENASGGEALHPETAPDNCAYDWEIGDAQAVEAALAASAHRVRLRVADHRVVAASMEPRGTFAEWDGTRLHVCVNGQGVWGQKKAILRALGLAEDALRVTTPDVGGGFGTKATVYPETLAIAAAARMLGRPVHWMSDRSEAMLSDNAGRDLVSDVEIGFDAALGITAYRVDTASNLGAYNSQFAQNIQSSLFSKVLTGIYDIGTIHQRSRGHYTNTTPVDAYRGAGRPEAILVLERAMDRAARALGVDPFELRLRNIIPADAFPYRTATDQLYDVGDFATLLERARDAADVAGFPERRAASGAQGKLRGLGLCAYVESILGDPSEGAAVEFGADGRVSLFVGTQSNGQGHETVYAALLSERTGIPVHLVDVIQGDSDRIATGGGTGGSRSVTVQGAATLAVVETMVAAFTPYAAEVMGVGPDALRFEDGRFAATDSNLRPTLLELAARATEDGRSDLLRHDARTRLPGRSYPNGAHLAEVEIDPETGEVRLCRYTVVDDFGNVLHPMLTMGQVHGGVAQGVGQALCERAVHDGSGQFLSASFMDYALPRAGDLPFMAVSFSPVPSTANPLGMKGCGEAGTVGALAAMGNAVQDAVAAVGAGHIDMPFTPQRVWAHLRAAGVAG